MWGWLPGRLILLRLLNGSGPAGGAASAERAAGRVSWVGSRGCGWLVRVGIGDTLSAACVWWWWVPPFCVLGACGGGMLSGFWGSAPWLPGSSGAPGCGGSWVGVGGLVVNCIVDASILL